MADEEDKESQTEAPTEKKLQDAVDKGNLPVSREVSILFGIAAMLAIAAFLLRPQTMQLVMVLERLIDSAGSWSFGEGRDAVLLVHAILLEMARFLAPLLAVITVAGLAASFVQHPPSFVFDRLMPDFSRISPGTGWKRLASTRGGIEFLKNIFKFSTVAVAVMVLLNSERDRIVTAMMLDPSVVPEIILSITMRILAVIGVATVLLVTADVAWSRHRWLQDLRMSRHEIKDELRQIQGDPLMKARLRSLALDRARKSMIAAVPRATLVIANPTHYAIALRYVREEGGAPTVLAKGQDIIALRIREIAERNSIPIIEDKALARSMYDAVEVNRMIPAEFYRAVAELIHFLQSRNGQGVVTR